MFTSTRVINTITRVITATRAMTSTHVETSYVQTPTLVCSCKPSMWGVRVPPPTSQWIKGPRDSWAKGRMAGPSDQLAKGPNVQGNNGPEDKRAHDPVRPRRQKGAPLLTVITNGRSPNELLYYCQGGALESDGSV